MSAYPVVRRRPRECKTCLPCRASKIRCDRKVPCGNCVKRNQGEGCAYGRPPPSQTASPLASSRVSGIAPAPSPATAPLPAPRPSARTTAQLQSTSSPSVSFLESNRSSYGYRHGSGTTLEYNFRSGTADAASDLVEISQDEWEEISSKIRLTEQLLASLNSLFEAHSIRRPYDDTAGHDSNLTVVSPGEGVVGASRKREFSPQPEPGVYGPNVLRTGAVHLGSRSALVDILDKSKSSEAAAQALPQEDLLAELALSNEAASYPFVDLWSSDPVTFNIEGVCGVLPDDQQCRRLWRFYRDVGAVRYPILSDLDAVEYNMNRLLHNRALSGGVYRPDVNGLVEPFGMSIAFLSLLFAILASGSQLSDMLVNERSLTSWVYISCAYQCLRMLNYVSQPTIEVVQILLIICTVLSYNMNASASYTLLGMTERMCMVLGMHVESHDFSSAEKAVRRRVWWAMAFQNSHFSLAYDRPSITMVSQPEIPFDPKSMPGHRSYFESICRIVSVALDLLRSRMMPRHFHMEYHGIRDFTQRIQRILSEASPHLRYRDRCVTEAQHIERTELRLHSSYLTSVLCRVALDTRSPLDPQQRSIIREECLASLVGTVEAFIELHSLSPRGSRSWISLQRTIASAFLLVATEDGQSHPQTWDLVRKLEDVLTDHVYADGAVEQNTGTETVKHLASSLRSLRQVSAAFRARRQGSGGGGVASAVATAVDGSTAPSTTTTTTTTATTATSSLTPRGVSQPSPLTVESLATDNSREVGTRGHRSPEESIDGEWRVRTILGSVSDVMLFPSMKR